MAVKFAFKWQFFPLIVSFIVSGEAAPEVPASASATHAPIVAPGKEKKQSDAYTGGRGSCPPYSGGGG